MNMSLIALAALLLLSSCAWPECNCDRSNAPCQAEGFLAAQKERCRKEGVTP